MSDVKSQGTAIVTGASQGIGAVYAKKLAERGYDLILAARNAARLADNARTIATATGRKVDTLALDLSDSSDLATLAQRLESDPSISLLVNNAGMSITGGLLSTDAATASQLIALNITAPTVLAQAAAKAFLARGRGAIVNIGSVTTFVPETFDGAYSGSKAYILNLTIGLASKTRGSGVKAQVVLPGPTDTDMWARSGVPTSVIPREKIMSPEDLVEAALIGLDRGEVVTTPTISEEAVWLAYEEARHALQPYLRAGKPAARYLA